MVQATGNSPESGSSRDLNSLNMLKAFSMVEVKSSHDQNIDQMLADGMPFTTLGNVLTALLSELKEQYVTEQTAQDKKMRKRITQVMQLVNDKQELANSIIKGNPFKLHKHKTKIYQGEAPQTSKILSTPKPQIDVQSISVPPVSEAAISQQDRGEATPSSASSSSSSSESVSDGERMDTFNANAEIKQIHRNASVKRRHNSMLVTTGKESSKWMQEYSTFNMEQMQESLILHATRTQSNYDSQVNSAKGGQSNEHSLSVNEAEQEESKIVRTSSTAMEIVCDLATHGQILETVNDFDFNCFRVSDAVGREKCFQLVVYSILDGLPKMNSQVGLNYDKLVTFLNNVRRGYREDVTYHNDLHGADVAQMFNLMLKHGDLHNLAQLSYSDLVSAVTACACHDFDHDGYNNTYHVNFMTDRALRYHDKAVQENWHASESIKLLLQEENNFVENFGEDEQKVMRKRIVGMILATDMADHMSHISVLDYKVKSNQITPEKNNGALMINTSNEKDKFQSQQQMLDFAIHAGDLSQPTRKFDTLRKWTYLLFEEFFAQGDLEKESGRAASFLCDRMNTVVCREQPGFCNYIITPTWRLVTTILPGMAPSLQQAQENIENWKNHEETEEERLVYVPKPKKKSVNLLKGDLNSRPSFSPEDELHSPLLSVERGLSQVAQLGVPTFGAHRTDSSGEKEESKSTAVQINVQNVSM